MRRMNRRERRRHLYGKRAVARHIAEHARMAQSVPIATLKCHIQQGSTQPYMMAALRELLRRDIATMRDDHRAHWLEHCRFLEGRSWYPDWSLRVRAFRRALKRHWRGR